MYSAAHQNKVVCNGLSCNIVEYMEVRNSAIKCKKVLYNKVPYNEVKYSKDPCSAMLCISLPVRFSAVACKKRVECGAVIEGSRR